MEARVQQSPQAHFLDDLLDGALLDARLTSLIGTSRRIVHTRVTVCHNRVLPHSLKPKKLRQRMFVVLKTAKFRPSFKDNDCQLNFI